MSLTHETSGDSENPTTPIPMLGSAPDRCGVCGSQLAVDQRYCVECGTRRGPARFKLTAGPSAPAPSSPPPVPQGLGARIKRAGSDATLLLGLIVILLAVGVGVLIGHDGSTKQKAGSTIVNANIGGGSGASNTSSAGSAGTSSNTGNTGSSGDSGAASSTTSSGSSKSSTKSSSTKSSSTKSSTKAPAAATKAASTAKSFGSSADQKSTIGGKCTAGTAGCVNGKQSTNLFGG